MKQLSGVGCENPSSVTSDGPADCVEDLKVAIFPVLAVISQ